MLYTKTFSAMVKYLGICFCFCVLSQVRLVYSIDDVQSLQMKIDSLKGRTEALEEENRSLSQRLAKSREECQAELTSLKNTSQIDKNLEEERLLVTELSNRITEKKAEEQIVLNSLSKAYLTNKKYSLKIELLSHEIELFQMRRKKGIDRQCQLNIPLLSKYNSSLEFRSLSRGSSKKASERATLLRLKVDYEARRGLAKKLTLSNEFLKFQIDNEEKMCKMEKKNFQSVINMTQEALLDMTRDKELYQQELDDVTKHLQGLYSELKEIREKIGQDKTTAEDLKRKLKDFDKDRECYVDIFNANLVVE